VDSVLIEKIRIFSLRGLSKAGDDRARKSTWSTKICGVAGVHVESISA